MLLLLSSRSRVSTSPFRVLDFAQCLHNRLPQTTARGASFQRMGTVLPPDGDFGRGSPSCITTLCGSLSPQLQLVNRYSEVGQVLTQEAPPRVQKPLLSRWFCGETFSLHDHRGLFSSLLAGLRDTPKTVAAQIGIAKQRDFPGQPQALRSSRKPPEKSSGPSRRHRGDSSCD